MNLHEYQARKLLENVNPQEVQGKQIEYKKNQFNIGIIGLGPRGLSVLERLIANELKNKTAKFYVYVFEPNVLGEGCHDSKQPEHLLVNTICSQITVFSDESIKDIQNILKGPSFYEWLKENYEENIFKNEYYSRARFGKYLQWAYNYLEKLSPSHIKIIHVKSTVINSILIDEKWCVVTEEEKSFIIDYLYLTTGHTNSGLIEDNFPYNSPKVACIHNPYPINKKLHNIKNNSTVAVEGLGLTAFDILSELTVGRGGKFTNIDGEKRYIKSGKEPNIIAFSRSGIPLSARAINEKGGDEQYKAKYFTLDKVLDLRSKGKINFEGDLLPLLLKEMQYAFYESVLKSNKYDLSEEEKISILELEYGSYELYKYFPQEDIFDWTSLSEPIPKEALENKDIYNQWLIRYLKNDIANALQGNKSNPLKSACDVLRDIRDNIRKAIDFSGLQEGSHRWLYSSFLPVMNRIAVGPPKERIEELLALIKAGIVSLDLGPNPYYKEGEHGVIQVISSVFKENIGYTIDYIIKARVSIHSPKNDSTELIKNLLESKNIKLYYNGSFHPGGIEVTEDFNIVSENGNVIKNAWALGILTEGIKFYTFIVPRPYINSTVIVDADKAVCKMLRNVKEKLANE